MTRRPSRQGTPPPNVASLPAAAAVVMVVVVVVCVWGGVRGGLGAVLQSGRVVGIQVLKRGGGGSIAGDLGAHLSELYVQYL